MKVVGALSVFLLICSNLGCSHGTEDALAKVTTEWNESKQALAKAQEQVTQLQAENQQLKQTAHFYFDEAVKQVNTADTVNTDKADRVAIAKFQEVVSRFPDDPLAEAAAGRIKNIEKRVSDRDLAIAREQAEVLQLVKICHESMAAVRSINSRDDVLIANRFDQLAISASALLAHERETKPYEEAARKAKEKAQALLQRVPDPDGTLGQKVDGCDSTEEQ
jgi:hypothetical protein